MGKFFSTVSSFQTVKHGSAEFELPILYYRDDMFALYFSADYEKVKARMPSEKLHPVKLSKTRAIIAIVAFNYIETSIGPYGEVGVAAPAVFADKPPLPLIPGLLESRYPGFGNVIFHLPVTNAVPRDAGRGEWGYTKFVSDMQFTNTPEYQQCRLSEGQNHILTLQVARRGITIGDNKPLTTYSVKDNSLIKTVIPQKGTARFSLMSGGSFLELGNHEVSESLRTLDLSPKPFMSKYYVERAGILPAGEIIERDVKSFEGYIGTDIQGSHETIYDEKGRL
jgi:Acetoacetate decarboxylase (ADC)